MRRISGWTVLVGCAVAALLLGACGGGDNVEHKSVNALNLDTGEKRAFADEGQVPGGWIVCIDERCTVPEHLGCQNLGPATCLLHPRCQLKLLCEFDIPGTPPWYRIEPQPGPAPRTDEPMEGPNAADSDCLADPDRVNGGCGGPVETVVEPRYAPQGCEFVCRGPTPRPTCDEIRDPRACEARSDCDWEWIAWAHPLEGGETEDGVEPATKDTEGSADVAPGMPCSPEYCPPPPQGFCRPARPQTCEQLDKRRCELRDDCEWDPRPCPCSHLGCDMACGPFCRPRTSVCPPQPPVPECKEGRAEPIYDDKGCLVRYECVGTKRCDILRTEYAEVLRQAKYCTPYRYLRDDGCLGGPGDGCIMPPQTHSCSIRVQSSLGCMGCLTFINAEHKDAVELLDKLRGEFYELGCMRGIACAAVECAAPSYGTCEYVDGSSQASCVDHY